MHEQQQSSAGGGHPWKRYDGPRNRHPWSRDTFVVAEDKTSGAETFKDLVKVMPVLFRRGGEDEDVINVGDAEGEIAEDGVYCPLKGGTSTVKAKAGVVEGIGAEGRGDGGLRDVVGMSLGCMGTW